MRNIKQRFGGRHGMLDFRSSRGIGMMEVLVTAGILTIFLLTVARAYTNGQKGVHRERDAMENADFGNLQLRKYRTNSELSFLNTWLNSGVNCAQTRTNIDLAMCNGTSLVNLYRHDGALLLDASRNQLSVAPYTLEAVCTQAAPMKIDIMVLNVVNPATGANDFKVSIECKF